MQVLGIDFTSSPHQAKPITCVSCQLEGSILRACELETWPHFSQFESALSAPGPWIAGIDFPFGMPRRFIENIGWPLRWAEYVLHAWGLGLAQYRETLDAYRNARAFGDKEHKRLTDRIAKSISPQKLYGVPVGLMFFQGAPRLVRAGVMIPGLRSGDPKRIVVEAYPGFVARSLIGRTSYKSDDKKNQTDDHLAARRKLVNLVCVGAQSNAYALHVEASRSLVNKLVQDPTGDSLDALLCAIQAGWAWTRRRDGYGAPRGKDIPLEGWIADPGLTSGEIAFP